MEPQITGKNMDVLPTVRQYIDRKLGKLNRHLPNIMETKIEVAEEKTKSPEQRFVVQVTINSNGTLLRGEDRGEDVFTAIDRVTAIMDRQIERFKGRRYSKKGNLSPRTELAEATAIQPSTRVTRVKRFVIEPMSVDEGIDQMELLGHQFFLFLNVDTSELNLVYRRKDGDYGVIEPVLG